MPYRTSRHGQLIHCGCQSSRLFKITSVKSPSFLNTAKIPTSPWLTKLRKTRSFSVLKVTRSFTWAKKSQPFENASISASNRRPVPGHDGNNIAQRDIFAFVVHLKTLVNILLVRTVEDFARIRIPITARDMALSETSVEVGRTRTNECTYHFECATSSHIIVMMWSAGTPRSRNTW